MKAYPSDWTDTMFPVQTFHNKYRLDENGREKRTFRRIALMIEELGEIWACIAKGTNKTQLGEELADLLILFRGTDLQEAFREKLEKLVSRPSKRINGRIRVSDFGNVD